MERLKWPWVKTMGSNFRVGAPPILVYFSGDFFMFTGGTEFDPWPKVSRCVCRGSPFPWLGNLGQQDDHSWGSPILKHAETMLNAVDGQYPGIDSW